MSAMKTKGSRACGKMFSLLMAVVMAIALPSPGGRFAAAFQFPLNWWLKERCWTRLKNF